MEMLFPMSMLPGLQRPNVGMQNIKMATGPEFLPKKYLLKQTKC